MINYDPQFDWYIMEDTQLVKSCQEYLSRWNLTSGTIRVSVLFPMDSHDQKNLSPLHCTVLWPEHPEADGCYD